MISLHRCADWPGLSLFPYDIKTSNFLNVEFTFKYRWQELFSHEKNPETQFFGLEKLVFQVYFKPIKLFQTEDPPIYNYDQFVHFKTNIKILYH